MMLKPWCSVAVLTLALFLRLTLTTSAAREPADLSPAMLNAIVTAAIATDRVIEQWAPTIDGADSEARAAQLRERADAAIDETEGMTLNEYRLIYFMAQSDPPLAARLMELFEQRTGN